MSTYRISHTYPIGIAAAKNRLTWWRGSEVGRDPFWYDAACKTGRGNYSEGFQLAGPSFSRHSEIHAFLLDQ